MIYLDNSSSTQPCSSALERMAPYFDKYWGASFAPHRMGSELIAPLESQEQMIREYLGASVEDSFVFTSSGKEAVNQVLWSVFLEVARKEGKSHFIVSELEDAPTMQYAKRLEDLGCTIKIAPKNESGRIDLECLKSLITPRTALISVTMAHGLTGVIQPYEEILQLAKERQVLLHWEATYAVGKIPFSFDSDYLTFSGDRIHSVKGSGGLLVKKGAPLAPLILGGREGVLDVPSLMALSAALQQCFLYLDMMVLEIVRLRNLFESLVCGTVLYQEEMRLPNVSLVAFKKVHQEALLYYLNRKGVYANIGGGYSSHLSLIDETAMSFSLSRMSTEAEIRKAAKMINETVQELQEIGGRV
ncbi:MAG: hypothetical protein ACD_17C00161G0003 [uncultured bacterium]|nr:MAG: hypothetical protein ACD_17C00161G0003 [uncultured bacterium]OGN55933.1 MAG: hypothetical protein A2796_05880 [Chlamydiae bacterium RIFCSPHIGHO2_01_FULL_44_39]OGN57455.1 MAG: hypothetical protein A3C42_04355 [Chlamydiae bacterium RIFCSPHIGHO2_02_FULL_45_9]OGN60379.1 MAG: hypothetical protein A3D96_06955 [Chlamydiae bacterium RIFCSPHIGHO2_12_FULL_44_59]OGN66364.1 MAG: hypothetical protein A2978_07015 [Chlamydiae bacterium RIFCSPLOWO2_01_FULL_44_52]OGN69397.1 MAG: hypothetical protein A3